MFFPMQNRKSVASYINNHPKWKTSLLVLKDLIDSTELHENIKWGAPVYTLNNKNIVGIGAFKTYVGLWFYQGVFLKDADKKLINAQEGKTKALRQWRFLSLDGVVNEKGNILAYIHEAIENHNLGKAIKPQSKPEFELPLELLEKLDIDPDLKLAFDKFSPSKQREFCEYISEAKQKTTKYKRVEKIIPMIKKSEGLNDKYRK